MDNDVKSFEELLDLPAEIDGRVPAMRLVTMPQDANPAGDIFGGWILAQMDLAGSVHAHRVVQDRIVTVGVEAMSFHKPVFIGDEVSFYTEVTHIGRTSISIKIESWAYRRNSSEFDKVTEGIYTYVRIDPQTRTPRPIDR